MTQLKNKFSELLDKARREINEPIPKKIEGMFLWFFLEGIKFNSGEKVLQ